jgi:hypothetical protein
LTPAIIEGLLQAGDILKEWRLLGFAEAGPRWFRHQGLYAGEAGVSELCS